MNKRAYAQRSLRVGRHAFSLLAPGLHEGKSALCLLETTMLEVRAPGMRVELLEGPMEFPSQHSSRQETAFICVRLPDGREGWIDLQALDI